MTATGDGLATGGSCPASPCLLRQAIYYADNDTQPDTIVLPASVTPYTLAGSRGTIDVGPSQPLTIAGAGSGSTEITQDGSPTNIGLLEITSSVTVPVTISGVNFHGGIAPAGVDGGAIFNEEGSLTLSADKFTNNSAVNLTSVGTSGADGGYGGAVYNNYGVVSVTGTAFSGNVAEGGGAGSQSGGYSGEGGALFNNGGWVTIGSSTFDGNQAQPGAGAGYNYGEGAGGLGGAILNAGTLVVNNSTFGATTPNTAGNSTAVTGVSGTYGGEGGEGGAIDDVYGSTTLNSDTLTGNAADGPPSGNQESGDGGEGGAIYNGESELTVHGGSFSGDIAQGATTPGSTEAGNGGYGGAIYSASATLSIDDGTSFTSDIASGGGYGTSSASGGEGGEGGAIYVSGGQLLLSTASFSSNSATHGTGGSGDNYDTYASGGALVDDGSVLASGVTFTGNSATADSDVGTGAAEGSHGGAVDVQYGGIASFANSTFTNNSVAAGGSGVSINPSYGGALASHEGGDVTLTADVFTGNTASNGYGGALSVYTPTSLVASTLSGNTAEYGGGLASDGRPVSVVNTTIDANTAELTLPSAGAGEGGGIFVSDGTLTLASDTIVANKAYGSFDGGNLDDEAGNDAISAHDTLIAQGSLLGGGNGNENCQLSGEAITDLGYNFEDRNQCGFAGAGDLVNQSDSGLGSLAGNGGPTQTVALLSGSSAINAGDPAGCTDALGNLLATDQRGIARPQGGRCDIGAYEFVPPTVTPPPPSPPAPVAPVLSGLSLNPGVFLSVAGGGSTILYSDSEAALTSFTVSGTVAGYRSGKGPCKALPKSGKRPKHTKACSRTVTASFSHQDVAGANAALLPGRPNGTSLPAGSYTLKATPMFSGLTGSPVTATFKIST